MVNHRLINGFRYHEVSPGLFVPGVTSILSATQDNTRFKRWRAKVGQKAVKQSRDAGINRGLYTHKLVERFIAYKNMAAIIPSAATFDLADQDQSEQYKQLGRSILEYASKLDSFVYQERSFYNERFAGTVDLVATQANKVILIDWKTSYKRKTKSQMHDYCLQLATYRELIHHNTDMTIDETRIVLVYSNSSGIGGVNEIIITPTESDQYYAKFLDRLKEFEVKQALFLANLTAFREDLGSFF
jgi:PD-(D/E)XK nuclease superfamily